MIAVEDRCEKTRAKQLSWIGIAAGAIGVALALSPGAGTASADPADTTSPTSRAADSSRPRASGVAKGPSATPAGKPRASRSGPPARRLPPRRPGSIAGTRASTVVPSASTGEAVFTPGPIVAFFFSDGTATHPNAGVLAGTGFSFTAATCAGTTACNGGFAGLLIGNGGSGFNGGNGGAAGLFGNGGNGGDAPRAVPAVNGGNGGAAGLFFGNGGNGGEASTGADGGTGGRGGLFVGIGGDGGTGGSGAMQCTQGESTCAVATVGGAGGSGGSGGLFGRAGMGGAAPLPLDSRLFVGYSAVYNSQVRPDGGGLVYPDDNDPTKPYAIPGTVVPDVQLPVGVALSRFGYAGGSYLATDGSFFAQLALPPSSSVAPYFEYVVADPTKLPDGHQIEQSQVAPWFGQPGGGMQYRITGPDGRDASVQVLLTAGFLTRAS